MRPLLRRFPSVLAAAEVLLVAEACHACPDCVTARIVRANVFDGDFWSTLGVVALPLLVLAAVSASLYSIGLDDLPPTRRPARRSK